VFPIIWPLAAFLYINNRKDTYIKWICLFLLIGGGGSYFALIHSVVKPYFLTKGILSGLEANILTFSVLSFMCMFYFLLPYVFLMSSFALLYRVSMIVRVVFLFPSIIFFILEFQTISEGINLNLLHLWAGLYIITGCMIYIYSIFKSGEQGEKRNYLRLSFIFVPIMILIYLKDFLFVESIILTESSIHFKQNINWSINSFYIDFWLLFLLFFYSIRYGILGIKLRFEKHRLNASITSMSFGTTIINHTIKNEVQKIEYMLERAKEHVIQQNETETIQSLDKIADITSHLQEMAHTIKEKSEEVELVEHIVDLKNELNKVTDPLMPILDKKNIILEVVYEFDGSLRCDPNHIREVLSNLCMNAIEAIYHDKGSIKITVKMVNSQLAIDIHDNGCGIDKKNWTKVFEPFFTSKKVTTNYGLGLTFCFQVMKKHRGKLTIIESEKNKGTLIRMTFPKKRLLARKVKGGISSDKSFVG
jgi:two-component system, sporulation sensor kinase B